MQNLVWSVNSLTQPIFLSLLRLFLPKDYLWLSKYWCQECTCSVTLNDIHSELPQKMYFSWTELPINPQKNILSFSTLLTEKWVYNSAYQVIYFGSLYCNLMYILIIIHCTYNRINTKNISLKCKPHKFVYFCNYDI